MRDDRCLDPIQAVPIAITGGRRLLGQAVTEEDQRVARVELKSRLDRGQRFDPSRRPTDAFEHPDLASSPSNHRHLMPGVDVSHQSIGLDLSIPERDETGHGNRPNRPAVKLLNDLGRGQSGSPLARPPDFLPIGPYSRTSVMRPAVCRSRGEDSSLRLDPRIGSPPPVFRRLPLGESTPRSSSHPSSRHSSRAPKTSSSPLRVDARWTAATRPSNR